MRFSVIYEVETKRDTSIRQYVPPRCRAWTLTEGDEQFEAEEYLGPKGKHRKWCGLLTREQFDRFVAHVDLKMEDVETMGSIGAPGCSFHAPAFSFRLDSYSSCGSAYVTPIPDIDPPDSEEKQARIWNRIKKAMLTVYG